MDDGGAFDLQFDEFGLQSEGKQPSLLGHKRVRTNYVHSLILTNFQPFSDINGGANASLTLIRIQSLTSSQDSVLQDLTTLLLHALA